ncbi:hypothetical protein [Paracoccus seriniphilus]|uniref:DUF4760 domain-containing protein n=1 Tax=Paracoccus seriniphilus TaxID=184748 RepID=A0A239PQK2_9RHOB|nr:hypothetical protein [Paracoccus seriniphilus]WCR13005.1 hypothetical protein JHW44_08555 [Paracoccus seriniphilus]SNT72559.1 hypothetical protein SAMN05444959_10357 [Paracoccus seriniphilus]
MPPFDSYLAPQAQQAVIAGLFLAIGWWVVAYQNRRRDAKLRADRVRDVQRALFAEIRAYLAALRRDDVGAYGAQIRQRILSEPGYFPVIPTENNDAIFRAIAGEIHVLPRDTVDPIVLYYSQLNAISAMIADLRQLDLAVIGPERAANMYRDYISMKLEALELGDQALAAIRANIDGRAGEEDRPSSPASGQFGQ